MSEPNLLSPQQHRRLRYRLSTLFALTTLLAIVGGWSAYQLRWMHTRHEFLKTCQRELGPNGFFHSSIVAGAPMRAPLPLWVFGEPGMATINFNVDLGRSDRPLNADEVEQLFMKSPHHETWQRAKILFPEASVGWGGSYRNLQDQRR